MKNTLKIMRATLVSLCKNLTHEYAAALSVQVVTGEPSKAKIVPGVAVTNEAFGTGIYYGGNRVVVGPRISSAFDVAGTTTVASDKSIEKAVAALSDKRVTSVLRNVAVAVHATFPGTSTDDTMPAIKVPGVTPELVTANEDETN